MSIHRQPLTRRAFTSRELVQRHQKVPIVFITAHADQAVIPRLIEQGAVACLRKPFSDTALREALDAALASP